MRVAPEPPPDDVAAELEGWTKAAGDLHSGLWPNQPEMRLWYKTQDQAWDGWTQRQAEHARQEILDEDIITELDVVYGDDDPWFGFERVRGGKVVDGKEGKWESVDIAFRRGNTGTPVLLSDCRCSSSSHYSNQSPKLPL